MNKEYLWSKSLASLSERRFSLGRAYIPDAVTFRSSQGSYVTGLQSRVVVGKSDIAGGKNDLDRDFDITPITLLPVRTGKRSNRASKSRANMNRPTIKHSLVVANANPPLFTSIELFGSITAADVLAELIEKLVQDGGAAANDDWQRWFSSIGQEWVATNRRGLAAVLEVAACVAAPGATRFFVDVLERVEFSSLAVAVAAQRLRLLPIPDFETKSRASTAVLRYLEWCISSEHVENVMPAIGSLPRVGDEAAFAWLQNALESVDVRLSRAAATAILDWTAPSSAFHQFPEQILYETCLRVANRLRSVGTNSREEIRLRSALVWLLGSIATFPQLPEVSGLIVAAFLGARGVDDAAAVRAGRLLARRFGAAGVEALSLAFQPHAATSLYRFIALLAHS